MESGGAGWLSAGRIGRPHGLDGSFYVVDPKPQLLVAGRELMVRGQLVRIASRKGTDRRPIVRLEGTDGVEAAGELRGEQLLAPRAEAPALGEDEWWAEELEGCAVRAGDHAVGTVRRLISLPSCEVLEVARDGGGADLLVPLVSDAVLGVDVDRREIEVDLEFLGEQR
jgi:16S rRNA processing protein RimM